MRKSELKRKVPLKRSTQRLARVAKRKLPAFRKAARWRKQFLADHPQCEAWMSISWGASGGVLYPVDMGVCQQWMQRRPCGYYSVDVHEVIKRGRGGSTTDEHNVLAVCRNCHDFTEAHPRISQELGLLSSNPAWRNR